MKILKSKKLLLILFICLISFLIFLTFPVKKPVFSDDGPSFSVSISNGYFTSGSLVPLTSTEQSIITLQSYSNKDSGTANISLYPTDESVLLNNFSHDQDNKKLKQKLDFSNLQQIMNQTINIYSGSQNNKVNLPLEQSGIWVLRIDFTNKTDYFFLVRSDNGVLVKEGDKNYIFWAQNFRSKKSVSGGSIKLYNLLGGVQEIANTNFDNEGVAKIPIVANADIAIAKFDKDEAIIPINLHYLNFKYSYRSFTQNQITKKYFLFTDRPIYQPGDTVYFKAIIRDDDDALYTKPQGSAKVSITKDYSQEPVVKQEFPISPDGTVFGEYKISKSSPTGYYTLKISTSQKEAESSESTQFQVQNFRKPEYSIDLTTDKTELIAQDRSSVKLSAEYFFNFPVSNRKVRYKILTSNYIDYEFYSANLQTHPDDYFYGFWGAEKVMDGQINLDNAGKATINFDAKIPPDKPKTENSYDEPHVGHNQVFSIEAILDDGTGNPSFTKKNVLVYAGEFDIFRKEGPQTTKVGGQISLPVILVPHFKAQVSSINLTTKVHRENWVLDEQQSDSKYPKYRKEEEDLPQLTALTDNNGNSNIPFTPQKVGYYTLTVNATDKRGNLVSKAFHIYVTSDTENYNFTSAASKLTVSANKDKYQPNETAEVTVSSDVSDTDIFLAIERGKVRRFSVIHLKGKSQLINIPLENGDIPNVFANVSSFISNYLVVSSKNLSVSTESKILKVSLTPDKQKYGPGDFVQLDIKTTDNLGNPVSADSAIWALDKALLELSDYNPDVIKAFWDERSDTTAQAHSLEGIAQLGGGGGCFSADTKVTLSNKTSKRIDQIKVGDMVLTEDKDGKLTAAKVLGIHKAKVDGYLIINTNLKVTPNHKIWVNGVWKEAGSIQVGDLLKDFSGKEISVTSLEWQKGSFELYNLEVDKSHTFFANSYLVHNEKGIDREIFKDLAYWNPSIHTDASGHAQVRFQLPDNLTTWVISTISATDDTKVGQQRAEIIVQKDVFIRPILPNILRVGDSANLGVIVHNFTDQIQELEINLQTDQSLTLKTNLNQKQIVTLKPADSTPVFWQVGANSETDGSRLTFSVKSKKDQRVLDSANIKLPIRPFEFLEKQVSVGQGPTTFPIQISEDTDKNKSEIILGLSPTLLGPIFNSMQYLINYPYGCVEQTVSRLAPALLVKVNPTNFAKALKDKNLDEIIQKSLSRLDSMQHPDGGFSWWQSGNSNYFITAYVVENLITAKNLGFQVSNEILKRAQNFLERETFYNPQTQKEEKFEAKSEVARIYGLSLLGSDKGKVLISQLDNLTPDLLSLAVLANIQNGFKDPQINGLNKLLSLKKLQGDDIYFEAGDEKNFGSEEASTALAIRAMLAGGAKDEDIIASVRFLTRNRKSVYFGNTFATSQVIKAVVEFSKIFKENNPNFSYTVSFGDKQLVQGSVQDVQTEIAPIKLSLSEIKSGDNLKVSQTGNGQLYSTLTIEEYNKNRNAKALNQGFSVIREYENTNGKKNIQPGDIVNIKITVSGQSAKNYYAVLKDELPAGLIPVNTALSNEQYYFFDEPSQPPQPQATPLPYSVTDTEVTENGMILSIYQINSGTSTFTYKARAVSEGKYIAPPAQIELMYNPKVYGRSAVDILEIHGVPVIDQIKDLLNVTQNNRILLAGSLGVVLIILVAGFLIYKRQKAS